MYAVASFNLSNYQELAQLTDSTKVEYCDRHGYKFFALRECYYSEDLGFNKIHYILDLFKTYPDIKWLLFSECDAMITNMTIKIEDCINDQYHFIIPLDRLSINAGNFLIRNSQIGRDYLKMILENESQYKKTNFSEQQVIADTYPEYKHILKIMPQRFCNSYEPQIYTDCDVSKDVAGNDATWQPGDFIVHWPGCTLETRLARANALIPLIVR